MQVPVEQGTHFFKSFSFGTGTRILASISAAFGQKVVIVGAVVAENHTRGGKVEDSHASANSGVSTIPVADDR